LAVLLTLLRFDLERPDPHSAVDALERFLSNDTEDWDAKSALGQYYILLGKPAGRSLLEQCWNHSPDRPAFFRAYLWALSELGEYEEVEQVMKFAQDRMPGDADCWRFIAQAL